MAYGYGATGSTPLTPTMGGFDPQPLANGASQPR